MTDTTDTAVVLTSVAGDHLSPVEELFTQISTYAELFGAQTTKAIIGTAPVTYAELERAVYRLTVAHQERLKIQAAKRDGEVR